MVITEELIKQLLAGIEEIKAQTKVLGDGKFELKSDGPAIVKIVTTVVGVGAAVAMSAFAMCEAMEAKGEAQEAADTVHRVEEIVKTQ